MGTLRLCRISAKTRRRSSRLVRRYYPTARCSQCYDKIEVLVSSCIVVASPRKEGVLEAVQRKIAEKWAKDLPDYMQADVWYPHTTLLQDMQADLGKIAQHLEENFEPFCGEVQTIEFSRVEKVGYTIVDTVELPNA